MPPVNIDKLSFDAQQAIGRQYLDAHGLIAWGFSVENLRNTLYTQHQHRVLMGYCDFGAMMIRVNYRVGHQFRQTMLHEIAHALLPPEVEHGMAWIELAGKIGVTLNHRFPYMMALALVKP
jgi:hypothetical protein